MQSIPKRGTLLNMYERAGTFALSSDLIDTDALIQAYFDKVPNPDIPDQAVVFGTSGHRGSAFDTKFNEAHIVAITKAIIEYRTQQKVDGPLFMGHDTHALSKPAEDTALQVLVAAGVEVYIDSRDSFTPTPAVSHAILKANGAPHNLCITGARRADGIVITPSHNPPRDGGFKYNPPHGGPADSDATTWIAKRANELLKNNAWKDIPRVSIAQAQQQAKRYDFREHYVADLPSVINLQAIKDAKIRIGADPMGGAAVEYWSEISTRYGLDLTVVNPQVDPKWSFMTLDWDEKIRMDCSSPNAMASLLKIMSPDANGTIPYDIATGNDADSDRHGIVTKDGLMNPNHYLAVAINYLFTHRPQWNRNCAVGKTLVSSSLIDRLTQKLGRELVEVPVGFKYFVDGLLAGSLGFGGEESAGASFLRHDGTVWTTDKDGIILCLLASEIMAVTGKSPSEIYQDLIAEFGDSAYARIDAPASREEKAKLANLSPENVTATTLAGEPILAKLVNAPGNNAPIGGLKVVTENAWFAARPSGTEDVYKIYAQSFLGAEHLALVQAEAKKVVAEALT